MARVERWAVGLASHEAGDPLPRTVPARQDDGDGGTVLSTIMHKEN
ncbi:hypothetical protein [Nocardia cyriacigeorgica]|nr:hypothetical protein [Nocardia cyriacigeorgica]NEW27952.1 hypothetical protein [Nocardia cyriacigeorgica]